MKTPPIQQKQAAAPQQEQSGQESEGKSLTPPAFQLKASEAGAASGGNAAQLKSAGPQGGGQGPIQRAGQVYKINNKQAALRGGAPDFKSLGKYIPKGTAVEILEEQSTDKDTFVRVKNVDSGAELGWTKKENVTGIQEHYKAAKASYTYHIGGYDLLVYVPKGIETATNPNIFLFFHGNGGDYSLDKKHTPGTYEFPDNPALSANMNDAVANSGSIAICPQGKNVPSMSNEWGGISADVFKTIVDQTLTQLSGDLGRADKPLKSGSVSVAGHSAGGAALGKAALGTGATDVTLQDAGYNFGNSWKSLREWFFAGAESKTVRVITRPNADDTHTLIDSGGYFDKSQIIAYGNTIKQKVTVEEFKGDGKTVEDGGIKLVRGFRVYRKDGSLMGSLRYYQRTSGDHWAASSGTMATSMTSGKKDKEADTNAPRKK